MCPFGHAREECSDPAFDWFPQRTIDYAERALAAANALYDEKHKVRPYTNDDESSWAEERSDSHPFHFRDGVHLWVSKYDLTPDADWL